MTMTAKDMDVRAMSGNIGLEIQGIDVTRLDDDDVRAVRKLWLDHLVVVFVGQSQVSSDDLAALAARFGEVYHHPMMAADSSPVHTINIPAGGYWHSDVTFSEMPPMASML